MSGLIDKRVFISGGCGDIGRAVAARFLACEGKVLVADILEPEEGRRVARSLHLSRAHYVHCDVTSSASVESAFHGVEEEFGGLDVAICCAGTVANEPFLQITEAN